MALQLRNEPSDLAAPRISKQLRLTTHARAVAVVDAPEPMLARLRAVIETSAQLLIAPSAEHFDPLDADLVLVLAFQDVPWERVRELVAADTSVLILVAHARDADELRAMESGAIGYLTLDSSATTLSRAMTAALRGEIVFSRRALGRWLSASSPVRGGPSRTSDLTIRQRQVASFIMTGACDKEIAAKLGIAVATVRKHVTKLFDRLGVSNRAAAVSTLLQRDASVAPVDPRTGGTRARPGAVPPRRVAAG